MRGAQTVGGAQRGSSALAVGELAGGEGGEGGAAREGRRGRGGEGERGGKAAREGGEGERRGRGGERAHLDAERGDARGVLPEGCGRDADELGAAHCREV